MLKKTAHWRGEITDFRYRNLRAELEETAFECGVLFRFWGLDRKWFKQTVHFEVAGDPDSVRKFREVIDRPATDVGDVPVMVFGTAPSPPPNPLSFPANACSGAFPRYYEVHDYRVLGETIL